MDISDVKQLYNDALAKYQGKEYVASLAILDNLAQLTPDWLRPFLLRAYILRNQGHFVSELQVLQTLLENAASKEETNTLSEGDRAVVAEAWSLLGVVCVTLGECRLGVDAFLHSVVNEVSWEKKLVEQSNAIFAANYCANFKKEEWLNLYHGYRELLSNIQPVSLERYQHSKVRIGYLSGDIRMHAVAWFLRPLLEHHNRERFQVYIYKVNEESDLVTEGLCANAEYTREVSDCSDIEICQVIQSDEIDILIDLSGHTCGNKLHIFAYKPAPILLSGIGYFNSTGLNIDGFLSDAFCSPASKHSEYIEPLIQLPMTHFCYQPWYEIPPVAEEMAWQKNGYITFGCFNNFSKVTDEMLITWNRILQAFPNSRLRLKHKLFDSEEGRKWTKDRMDKLHLPLNRIEFKGFSAGHMWEYQEIDIALDTFPYVGGLTTCEALIMGVPVVSLYGSRHGTRFGFSFLSNIDLTELAVTKKEEYVKVAVALAQDKELLLWLHHNLRAKVEHSPWMNGAQYCAQVETVYRKLYEGIQDCGIDGKIG